MRLLSCVSVAVLLPFAARAQSLSALCASATHPNLTVGRWSSYADTHNGETDTVRMAIVGSEVHGDTTYHWWELATVRRGERSVFQFLIPTSIFDMRGVRDAILKEGDKPAMRLPVQAFRLMNQNAMKDVAQDWVKRCTRSTLLGYETVSVPAGSFRAAHVRSNPDSAGHGGGDEVWADLDIPFALVKMVQKNGDTMVLTAKGSGAKSSITEKPQEMTFPGMGH